MAFLKEEFPQCFDDQEELHMETWAAIWFDGKEIPGFIEDIVKRLSHHYLKTDMVTWRLLRHTRKRLYNQSFVLAQIHHSTGAIGDSRAKRVKYTTAIIHNCLEILEVLTSRALEEIEEDETERRVRIDRNTTAEEVRGSEGWSKATAKALYRLPSLDSSSQPSSYPFWRFASLIAADGKGLRFQRREERQEGRIH